MHFESFIHLTMNRTMQIPFLWRKVRNHNWVSLSRLYWKGTYETIIWTCPLSPGRGLILSVSGYVLITLEGHSSTAGQVQLRLTVPVPLNNNKKQPNQKMSRRPKQTFLWRRHTDGQNHMKRCLMYLIIKEMQIKTTMRYYVTQVRMAIIKKSTGNKCWRGCGEKRSLLLLVGM